MKISVFGGDREIVDRIIKRLETLLKTEAVVPETGSEHPIVEMAKETYGQTKRNNVVYDGCVLQYLKPDMGDECLFDVYEQIALTSLVNIDLVLIVPDGMDNELMEFYSEYSEIIGGGKITFINDENNITV